MPPATATVPLLHRFLGIGLVIVAVAFVAMRLSGVAPLAPVGPASAMIAYVMSGIAMAALLVALLVFKPRAPRLEPGQSAEQYWKTPATVAKVLPVWFLLEGTGTLSSVAYLMTGHIVAAAMMGLGVIAFWFTGPEAFAR